MFVIGLILGVAIGMPCGVMLMACLKVAKQSDIDMGIESDFEE